MRVWQDVTKRTIMTKFVFRVLISFSFLLFSFLQATVYSDAGAGTSTLSETLQGSSLPHGQTSFLYRHPLQSTIIAVSLTSLIMLTAFFLLRARSKSRQKQSLSAAMEALRKEALESNAEITSTRERLQREIEDRSRAEDTLRAVLDAITETLVVLDLNGTAMMVNEEAAKRLGHARGEIEGTNIFELFPGDIKPKRKAVFEEVIRTGNPALAIDVRDGRTYQTNWYPVSDKDGRMSYIAVFAVDITERGRDEEERIRTEKLESVGLLAGGIAHDFNNLLTGIMGFVDLSKTFAQPDSRQHKYLSEALSLCHKAKGLTRRFTTFAKGGDPLMRPIRLSSILRDTLILALSGSNADSELFVPSDLWQVECDEMQLRDVFTSVIINAREAMPSGGKIEVSAANIDELPADLPGRPSQANGGWVHITVRDFGIGIPAENLPKLFLPYFSTKERGAQKGMGLSLPTAYSIVRRHGGAIQVESEPGKGTSFHIYLPMALSSRSGTGYKEEQGAGPERILVMDDEDTVLEVADSILERGGFEIKTCKDGREAIELYKNAIKEGKPFTGVILDLTIRGGMGGREVVKELLSIDPRVKAIVSSGYSEDPVMSNYSAFGFCGAVAKPYDIRLLLRAANRAFRPRSPRPADSGNSCTRMESKDSP
jgi:PAS domain S-box-containing protein